LRHLNRLPAYILGMFAVVLVLIGVMMWEGTPTRSQEQYVTVTETPEPPPLTVSEEALAKMQEQSQRLEAESESRDVDGPETAGATIQVAGRDVKLPDHVQMDGMLITASCMPTHPDCDKDLPYLVLRDTNVPEQWLGLKLDTGKIIQDTEHLSDEGRAEQLSRFQWLVDAVGAEQ